MSGLAKILQRMRRTTTDVRFDDLAKVCDHFFGAPRRRSGSHSVYRTPWQGDPRVNIQNDHGMAKPYQVRQVLAAIDRLQKEEGT